MLYQGYKNGSPVSGATLNANTPSAAFPSTVAVTFSTIPAFQDVDDIRVSPASLFNSNFQLWDVTIGTATPVVSCPTPTLTLSGSTPVSCNGGSNGSATVSASGGSPFTYTWSPSGGNAATATGLSAMTYTCNTTNSCGATASQTVSITQPISALNTSTLVSNNLCNGASTGAATITASGGTSPYTYMWSTGATTSVISSRPAGAYTGTVTDVNGCTSSKVATITQPSALVTTTGVTNVLCNGASTGAATITASGGTGAYTYMWSTGATTSVISSRPAGAYTGTVTDANGCTSSKVATITQPAALIVSSSSFSNSTGSNGSAGVVVTGGTGAYTYSWSPGNPTGQGTASISALAAGTYTCIIKDVNNCSVTATFTISSLTPGAAIDLTTANDYISLGNPAAYNLTSSMSFEMWLKPNTSVTNFVRFIENNFANGYYLGYSANGPNRICLILNGTVIQTGDNVITPNVWQHIAVTFNNSTDQVLFYVNGTQVFSGSYSGTIPGNSIAVKLGIESSLASSAYDYSGQMDELRIWNRSLCQSEIQNNMNAEINGPYSGLVGCYHFNQGNAASNNSGVTSLTDASGNGYTGTLINFGLNGATSNWVSPGGVTSGSIVPAFSSTLSTSIATSSVLCNGGTNGSATVTANGGAPFTYSWMPSGGTSSVASGLAAGAYTVRVTNACGTFTDVSVNINQPTLLNASNAAFNVPCFGSSNGAINLTVSGGTPVYTFNWGGGITTEDRTGLMAGVYSCTITDANGCTATSSATITQPSALTSATAVTNILCFGNSTGAATVTASGGTSPYTYAWSGAQTTSVISGQLAGVKSVTVTDANNCTTTNSVNITQPGSGMTTSTAVVNVLCFGNSTGSATVTASGGAGSYNYAWSTGATTSVITTLNAGVRTVTVTDASSCTSTNTVTITQPAANTVSINILNNVSCFGGNNGALTATGMTGTGPYSFMWSPGTRTTATYTSAAVGVYTVLVSDANACEATATATITQPTALVTNTAVTNILCFGNSTGAATVTASGGTSPYSYVWSGALTTSVISSQLAGVKTVTLTDANSCTVVATANITQPASALATSTAVTNVLCFGNSTGAATITASGGTSPYTYVWSSAQTTSVISGQLAGARTVTVTDANNCTTTNSVNITQPGTGMTTSTAAVNVLCFGNSTGAATVTATGGSGAYTYAWSTGATTSVITTLNAGVRTVTVSDASSCTSTNTVTITQPASALTTATAITNVACFGNSTGAATVTASGGTSPYSYVWSGAQTTSVISGQLAGVNTVTVTDANSCTMVATANITQPASALATSTAVTNVLCFGNSTGAATVTASGGTSPYTYAWSGAQTTSVISGQLAGVKSVTVTDANNCSTTNSVNITQPGSGMTTSTAAVNVLCFGNSTGSATVTATGGSGAYTYAWSSGATTSVITTLNVGVRTVTVSDASSCTSTNTVTITQPASALTTTISSVNPLCNGGVGSSTISASGGTGAYSIVWSTAATSSVIASLVPGVYTATVTDINSCVSTKTATITTPPALSLTANSNTASICSGNTATLTASASGGTGILTYTWTNGLANATQTVNPNASNLYTIQATDANSCTIVQTVSLTVNTTPSISVASYTICNGATATLIANGADTYTWSTGSNSNSITVSPTSNTVYVVNGQSTAGCVASTQNSSVTVSSAPSIVVNSSTICSGQSATLTASGVTTYSWNNGATTSSIVVSPSSNTVYIVNGTLTGCPVPAINNGTVDVIPVPTIAATSGTICEGQSFVIVPSGANTYTINSGSFTVNPTSNTSYSVSGTGTNGCVSTTSAITTITVHPNPTISVSSGSICEGQTYTIIPSGASTYTFSNGSNTISPLVTTSYSVTGTSSVGCAGTNTASGTVTVYVNPTITVPSGSICSGQTFTLNPSGANTYTYSSTNNTVAPITTTTYSIIGTSTAGCVSTSSGIATVSVSASPTISVNSGTICSGQSFTLVGNGANTYTYSSGNVVSPVNTDTYSVVGTSTAGCLGTNTAIATVSVFALPQLTVASQSICNGATATLTALGANTYTWSNLQNTQSITVNPLLTTTYTAIGTSTDGCVSSSVTTTVTVTNAPSITVNSSTICNGFSATLTASGVDTYSWNTGPTTSIIVVNPTSSTNYTVTGFQNGCSVMATNTTAVLVNALPNVSITSIAAICNGKTATLIATGADTYTWSNNQNGNTTTVSPSTSTAFSVVGTNSITGCNNSANFNLTVYPLPTLSISGNFIICYGNTSSLTATGAQTYTWSNGLTGSLVNLTPTVSTDYTLTGTDINGCENNTSTTVSVTTLPTLVVSQGTVCAGKTYTLVPSGATSYTYSSGSAAVTPSATTIYTISGSSAENCVNSTTVSVVVFANPTINAGPDLTIKIYDSFTLNATSAGATSYTWSPASMVQNPNILQATGIGALSSDFTVIASSSVGCTSSATVNVSVNTDNLEISNYMSPNGDGVNDKWKVNNTYFVKDYSVEVLDQWGHSVFNKSNNYDNEWDGNDQNGRPVPDGVYYYVFLLDGVVKHSGSITLLR